MEERLPYRLLALDLDGTIVNGSLQISPRVRRALCGAMDSGVHVTLASGRPFDATRVFASDLGIQKPLICHQGALVRDACSGATYFRCTLPRHLADEVIDIVREHGWVLCLTLDDEQYVERPGPALRLLLELSPTLSEAHVVADLKALSDDALRLLVVAPSPTEADTIDKLLHERFAGRLAIVRSYSHFVEATDLGASKGQALAFLAQRLGVSQAETMAIGDNDNDADMVAWAGLGVAMGNASAAVKAAAKHITATLAEDGAALAIERFILGRDDG
jgi:Cof subfamily protein (haloacid dehalogenase superfamily)